MVWATLPVCPYINWGSNGSLINVLDGRRATNYDANNPFTEKITQYGPAARNLASASEVSMWYAGPNGLLHGATAYTILSWFVFDAAATSAQWLNFRVDNQHSLDIFSKTANSLNWGTDWAGAWNGLSQKTLSNLATGSLVCVAAAVNQSGARMFHNGIFAGTKAGGAFTISSAAASTKIVSSIPAAYGFLGNAVFNCALPDFALLAATANPFQIFEKAPHSIWIDVGDSAGPVVVTTSASGRLRSRASVAVAATKTTFCTARERAIGAASTQPIKAVAGVGRERARGSNATTPSSIVSAVGRRCARGSTSASQVAPGIVVTSAVGRERVRGSNTATSIRTVAVVGRRRMRGAGAASSIRAQLAAGRVRARGTTTAAPIVAGTVVTSAVGRLRARGSSSCTTTRVTALAGRVRARGSDAVSGFRVVAVTARRRARGVASAGPAGVLVDSIAASRLCVRGTTAAVAMPPLVLVPGRVCIGARQPASVAINASILACDCN